jgi:hypothetical protein
MQNVKDFFLVKDREGTINRAHDVDDKEVGVLTGQRYETDSY